MTSKKGWNKSCLELNFVQESPRAHISILPTNHSGARGRKIDTIEILLCTETEFNLGLNTAKNMHQIKKNSNKSCSELNFVPKSPRAHTSISPSSGAQGSRDQYVWNLITYRNRNLGIEFRPKKSANTYVSLPPPPQSGARGSKEFNFKKLWALFHVMRIFGSVQPLNECNLPFPYRTILRTC